MLKLNLAPPAVTGAPQFSEFSNGITPATQTAIDESLALLQLQKNVWVSLNIAERITILDEIIRDLQTVAAPWVLACTAAKHIAPHDTFGQGEEWVFLTAVFRLVRLLRRSLLDIQKQGCPQIPGGVTTRPNGQVAARVCPQSLLDRMLLPGTSADIWMKPGITVEDVWRTQASFYRNPPATGSVALVLGAGNVSSLVPGDFLYALFVKGQVVALKPNPVNAYLGPLIEKGFKALVKRGFLKIIYGGVAEGDYLCHHPAVEAIHLTGSDKTFESIVFGSGPKGAARKAKRRPLLTKPVTAELGNVSPIIVVPGPWRSSDVQAQAMKIATWLVVNSGFNCLTPRVIIQSREWPQREALLRATGAVLSQVAPRRAYYPGAATRHSQFVATHPHARRFGAATNGQLPWTFITGVNPQNADDICFRSEAFCGLMAETTLAANDIPQFVDKAVDFANKTVWGTLTATLIVHPKSLKEPRVAAAIKRAVANLRYGTVLVNQYGGYGYFLMLTSWGGFPGQDIYNIQSGVGVVNNTLMFEHPQKSVVYSPFRQLVDPFTATFKNFHTFGQRLADLEASPSVWKVPPLLASLLQK